MLDTVSLPLLFSRQDASLGNNNRAGDYKAFAGIAAKWPHRKVIPGQTLA